MRLEQFLRGWRCLTIPVSGRSQVMDVLYRNGISFRNQRVRKDGGISLILSGRDGAMLEELEPVSEYELGPLHGLPTVISFLRFRCGIAVGFVLMALWLLYSSRIIWDVRVTGNTKTPTSEIVSLLEELGCGVGDYFPDISFNDVHAWYLARQDDISWLSVYMNGTVAEVQVRELLRDERNLPDEGVYANVVADRYGVVEEVHVKNGSALVREGDVVVPGQVLISGVTELKDGSYLYEYADGEVICRTVSLLEGTAQRIQEVKEYTGEEKTEISVKIFKKNINLFIKGGIEEGSCDKINMMEQVCLFGDHPLPLWIEKTVYRPYCLVRKEIPADDAAAEAMAELSGKIKDEAAEGELVSREIRDLSEDCVTRIACTLYLRRDNGRTEEFRLMNPHP